MGVEENGHADRPGPRPYLIKAAQIEGYRCGYYLNTLFLDTRERDTEPGLQPSWRKGSLKGV